MDRLSIAKIAAAALLMAGCGDGATPEGVAVPLRPATLAELTGPWRQAPLFLDLVTRGRVEQACRRDIEMPPGATAIVIDVRGAGVATVRMGGVHPGSCDALEISADGHVNGAGAGWRGDGGHGLEVPGAGELGPIEKQTVSGGSLTIEGWSIYGRAGPGIASVVVEPQNHPAVIATLENGWFGAWWPARPGEPDPGGARYPPFVVRAYDAMGTLLDELAT